jgi:hypothetical protein
MRTLLLALVFGFAGLLAVDLEPSASPGRTDAATVPARAQAVSRTVEVAFVRDGELVRVERVVPKGVDPAPHALKELTQGPTREERARGIRTAIPEGARLRSLRRQGDLWFASFSRSLFGPGTAQTTETRLRQISATLASLGDQQLAAIAAEGRLVTMLRLGLRPAAWRAVEGEKGYPYSVRGIQLRLLELGYLARSQVTGELDYSTSQALLAFQGWEGIARTGSVTGQTQVALVGADRPRPKARSGSGRRVEIHRDLGVLLMVEDGDVERVVHTSTGAAGLTPSGTYRVYRKELLSWSVPFKVWMPFASYFVGGIAMHEYSHVPEYPASHGCVRLPAGDAERVFRFAEVGTPVHVF